MSRKRDICICGYEGRSDNVIQHKKKCGAVICILDYESKIENLQKANNTCNEQISILRNLCASRELKSETLHVAELKREIELKNDIIKKKDEKIDALMTQMNCTNVNVTNNINLLNVCPIFGKEPKPDQKHVYTFLKNLCVKGYFQECVPEYIRLKYLNFEGIGNIKILNKRSNMIQLLQIDTDGCKKWMEHEKKSVIDNITVENLDEVNENYGTKLHCWSTWYNKNKLDDVDSVEFQNVRRKVEMILSKKKA